MKQFLFIVIASIFFASCDNIYPSYPSDKEMILNAQYPMVLSPGSAVLEAKVPDICRYTCPKPGAPNCNGSVVCNFDWKIFSSDDYVEVTIIDNDGVDPGAINAKAYTLTAETSTGTIPSGLPAVLIMKQSDTASVELFQMTWRFKLGGVASPSSEIGHGTYAPAIGLLPFERPISQDPLGCKWKLSTTPITVPSGITATITYHLSNKNVKVCK